MDCACGISAGAIKSKWAQIRRVIDTVPTYDELVKEYNTLGVKSTLTDIGVSESTLPILLEYSPLVRNRLTLMRLRRAIK